jgi:hypothetical protein
MDLVINNSFNQWLFEEKLGLLMEQINFKDHKLSFLGHAGNLEASYLSIRACSYALLDTELWRLEMVADLRQELEIHALI